MNFKHNKSTVHFFSILFVCLFVPAVIMAPLSFAQTPPQKEALLRQYMEMMGSVFGFISENYVDDVDPEVIYKGAMKGMLDSFNDPYSIYVENEVMTDLKDTTQGTFGGVGLTIGKPFESTPEKPAFVQVGSPIEDGPGWKAGIIAGDYIVEIDGIATPDIDMNEVLSLLRGKVGTKVSVVIQRGKTMEFPVTLTRALIEVPTVKFSLIKERSKKIGYLKIIEFTPKTAQRVEDAIKFFKTENIESLLIDLRNNPGGLITSVSDVADKFIKEGVIVTTKSRLEVENSQYTARKNKTTMPFSIPIVVLMNGGSASASEILAGCLKDHHRALLAGEKTYGKGSVQRFIRLSEKDGIKLTMARYYTPSDANIDKTGILPDIEIDFPALSEEEENAFVLLAKESPIDRYVEEHPSMTEDAIKAYAQELSKEYPINERLLRRLIRLEVLKTKGSIIYDYDFDVQLQKALDIFDKSDFEDQLKNAKSVKIMQDETLALEVAEKETSSKTGE